MPPLKTISVELHSVLETAHFHQNQRLYNGLFAFTAMGAGSPLGRRKWTDPSHPLMLTMRGCSYHRIFDAESVYRDLTVTNNSRFYIYEGEFDRQHRDVRPPR